MGLHWISLLYVFVPTVKFGKSQIFYSVQSDGGPNSYFTEIIDVPKNDGANILIGLDFSWVGPTRDVRQIAHMKSKLHCWISLLFSIS